MIQRWTRAVIRHRLIVIVMWILIALTGFFAQANLGKYLTTSLEVPGSQSARANAILAERFDENTEGTFTILYKFKASTLEQIEGYKSSIVVAASVIPDSVVTMQRAMGGILFSSINTSMSLLEAANYTDVLRKAISAQNLDGAQVTGPPAINHDVSPVLANDLTRGKLVAIAVAFLLLILMLGTSFAAIIPLLFATASISLALSLVYLLAQKTLMVLYIPNIIELIGLGLAIDYSLLIVHRFRRELGDNHNRDVNEAVVRTMATAGRTVLISGLSVWIALAALLLVPLPFVRSLGIAGMLVPISSTIAALTFAPALLSFMGHAGATSFGFNGLLGKRDVMAGGWAKIARFAITRPKSVFIGSLATLAILASPLIWLAITPSSLTAIPANLESSQALTMVTNQVGPGIITPHELVIDLGRGNLASTTTVNTARLNMADGLLKNPEVFIVATQKTPA